MARHGHGAAPSRASNPQPPNASRGPASKRSSCTASGPARDRRRTGQIEPVIFNVPRDSELAAMLLAGRETLPLKFALRANRAHSGEDFASLTQGELRSAFLTSLNGVLESAGRPLLTLDSTRYKIRPCMPDASGSVHTVFYALGVACSQDVADFLRQQVEASGAGIALDLGRSAPAHAMLYDGDYPADCQYHIDITADSFGKVGPEVALSMLKLQGFNVASVTEVACHAVGDGPLDFSGPVKYKSALSVGRAPMASNQDHVVNRWSRPATALGDRRMVALVAGGHDFMAKTFKAGSWVRVQLEHESGKPIIENLRYWRMSATLPPRARPILTVARGAGGATGSGAEPEASPRQPPATGGESPRQPLSYKEVASAAASPRQAVAGMPTVAGSAGLPASSGVAAPAGTRTAAQERRHPAGEGQGQEGRRPEGKGQDQEGR